jgi:2-keto-3-deoxy-L-rhamnonate aldolase RhmA
MPSAYPSSIRQRIADNDLLLSTSMFTRQPNVAAAIYQTGPDWVWIDQEHQPWGTESIGPIAVMGRQAGVAPVIRVSWNDPGQIKKAYDVGAVGVMVPQVDNEVEAAEAIKYARYPPLGERGIAPFFATYLGITADEVIKNANSETVLILQVESAEAYERLDETLKLKDFDVVLFGPADMAASIGVPGKMSHPKVENMMVDVAARMKKSGKGKALATTWADPELARKWIGEGYRMMNVSSCLALGTTGTKRIFAEFREQFGKPASRRSAPKPPARRK